MIGYFREYVQSMSSRIKHLHSLLCKGTPFVWTDARDAEFKDLEDVLISPDVMLYHPDFTRPFELHTDASKHGCGAMLAQLHDGELRGIKFASRSFTPVEARWPTTHQELFAAKWSLDHFHPYILGRKLKVITDHATLKWLTSISLQQSKLARWCLSMAEFDFVIEHCAGTANIVPDVLSRAPLMHPPSTTGDNLCHPPQPVVCFLTGLLGFDILSLEPLRVFEIFSDTLHCISFACNPGATVALLTNPKSHPVTRKVTVSPPIQAPLVKELPLTFPLTTEPSSQDVTPCDPASLYPLNFSQAFLAQKQRQDQWLGPLYHYLAADCSDSELAHLSKNNQTWVKSTAARCKIIDDLIMYADVLMDDPTHYCILIPSDPTLQCHLIHAYHESPLGMHRGRDATYNTLSHDFYWRHMAKHVRNWVRHCPQCIRFKSFKPSHGPMQLRLCQHPFHTLGVDYVGERPVSPTGNRWILTTVCPYSNYLCAIPVPDKTATTAAHALFNNVFLQLGFPTVLQSDHGGEFLNAL